MQFRKSIFEMRDSFLPRGVVAQLCKLLYRGFETRWASANPAGSPPLCRLQIGDTAACKAALPVRRHRTHEIAWLLVFVLFSCGVALGQSDALKPIPGLSVRYSGSQGVSDVTTAPNVWLYVPSGQPPTPFLPEGKFTAVWTGYISADLRGDFSFQAELNGTLKLEINGETALDATGTNSTSGLGKSIRLNKGTNAFVATFTSPAQGDAFVRLEWKPKDSLPYTIPMAILTHLPASGEEAGKKLRLGRELFVEHHCAKCHLGPDVGMPELGMDAPNFEEIGARRNPEWMAQWIEDPKKLRASAHMPRIFSGDSAAENSAAIAAYLGSLKPGSSSSLGKPPDPSEAESGKNLFATLHCAACHDTPGTSEVDVTKVSLKQVSGKFASGSLVEFLKQPDLHYAWIRMPRFVLSDDQRDQLAAYLLSTSEKAANAPVLAPANADSITRGQLLVQTAGCLNCHASKLENQFSAGALAKIADWKSGCMAEKPVANSKAPQFDFTVGERDALHTFADSDRSSLGRHVPVEFAERQSRGLNCIECHGKIEGVPAFEILGGKLKPEWSARFLAGEISDKPRPWLESQMPSLGKRAQFLAEGLSMQHGFPPKTPVEKPIDPDAAEVGRKLVSVPPLGFSCVSCHSAGNVGATQVFEAPGINLASSGERLQPSFFKRWLRNPALIDPTSKMPVYFDEEGNSPLTDVYEGSGDKQIGAFWQYLRLGDKMPAPNTQ